MEVLQELLLQNGVEICRITVHSTSGGLIATISHGKQTDPGERLAVRLKWETTAQVEALSSAAQWQAFICALVALKLKDGFHIQHNYTSRSLQSGHTGIGLEVSLEHGIRHPLDTVPFERQPVSDAQKREKKGGTSILHLAQYFHYPINEAAKLLDICPTVLKKICRKHGLRRWPHRKLRSIEKMLQKLDASLSETMLEGNCNESKLQIQQKVNELKAERALLRFDHLRVVGEPNEDE